MTTGRGDNQVSIANRVALVTGGSVGIGRSIALALGQAGADVAVNYRTQAAEAEETAAAIRALGRRAVAVCADVRDTAAVEAMMAEVAATLGGLHILVNNAGVAGPGLLAEIGDDDWDLILDVNLKGAFLCCRAAVPRILAAGGGSIVNIGSNAGRTGGTPHQIAYAASKAGLDGLTKALSRELVRQGVRVNCVAPTTVGTEMVLGRASAEELVERTQSIPLGRFGKPEEVAAAVVFLADDAAAAAVTGQTLYVNGGAWMG